jgi:hypothetical protein
MFQENVHVLTIYTTEPALRFAQIISGIKHKKNIVLEQPLVSTIKEAKQLLDIINQDQILSHVHIRVLQVLFCFFLFFRIILFFFVFNTDASRISIVYPPAPSFCPRSSGRYRNGGLALCYTYA